MTPNDSLDVIAAFVDGERVDPAALKSALAHAEGRDYLADLVALREVVGQDGVNAESTSARPARRWLLGAAAAIVLSLGGGMALGHRLGAASDAALSIHATDIAAPQPTRVIEVTPDTSPVKQEGK